MRVPEDGKHRNAVPVVDRVIPPLAAGDAAAIDIQDLGKLATVEIDGARGAAALREPKQFRHWRCDALHKDGAVFPKIPGAASVPVGSRRGARLDRRGRALISATVPPPIR